MNKLCYFIYFLFFADNLNPSSPHNDSSGTHSMGTSSAGSPVLMDDEDTCDYISRDIISDFTFGHFTTTKDSIFRTSLRRKEDLIASDYNHTRNPALHRSKTNADGIERPFHKFVRSTSKPEAVNNAVSSKYVSAAVSKFQNSNEDTCDNKKNNAIKKNFHKDGKSKLLSSYLSKAKEGFKAVTSTISGSNHDENQEQRKGRPSRAPKPKMQKRSGRSASVGAPTFRQENYLNVKDGDMPSKLTLSPRSQLKQVRQNLKKVNADYRYGVRDFSSIEFDNKSNMNNTKSQTSLAKTCPDEQIPNDDCAKTVDTKSHPADEKPPTSPRSPILNGEVKNSLNEKPPPNPRSRPLSLIENQHSFHELQKVAIPPSPSTRKKSSSEIQKRNVPPSPSSRKKSLSSVNDENSSSGRITYLYHMFKGGHSRLNLCQYFLGYE